MFLDIYITFIYLRFVPQLPMQGRFKKEFDIFTPGPYIADKRFSMLRRMSLITWCNLINAIVQCMSCCFGNGDLCRYGNHPQSTCSVNTL